MQTEMNRAQAFRRSDVRSPEDVVAASHGLTYPQSKQQLKHIAQERRVKVEIIWVIEKVADRVFDSERSVLAEVRRVY